MFYFSLKAFYSTHIIPSESAVINLVRSHCESISDNSKYSIGPSLMMLAVSAVKLLEIGASKLADNPEIVNRTLSIIIPCFVSPFIHILYYFVSINKINK